MVFQSVPETAEVAVISTLNGQAMQNTYHARKLGGYSFADLESLANAVDVAIGAGFKTHWSVDLIYNHTEARGLELENDQVILDTGNAGAGSVASAPLPNNVSFAVRKLSGFTGRSARGRVYVYGIPGSYLSSNENLLTGTAVAAYVTDVDAVRGAISAIGWVPVIVSRYSGGLQRPTGVTFVWTLTSAVDSRVDSRRDRLPT